MCEYQYDFTNQDNFSKNQLRSYDFLEYRLINKQINLAKSHGLYGFAFLVCFYSGKIIFDRYLNTFLKYTQIKFKYLFIFKHRNLFYRNENILILQKYNINRPQTLISKVKKYLIDNRYIKINSKPIICIDNIKNNEKLISLIKSWKLEAKNIGFEDLFIITSLNKKNISDILKNNIYNAGFEYLPKFLLQTKLLRNFIKNYTFFTGLIYNDILFEKIKDFPIYRGSTLENECKIKNNNFFGEYSPESFYLMNKLIIDWTSKNNNDSKTINPIIIISKKISIKMT